MMDDDKDTNEQLREDVRMNMLASMYGADDEPKEQPIQLRLAGKATVVNINDQQVAIPRIEYIEALEAGLRALKAENDQLRNRLKHVERMHHSAMNIAGQRARALESDLRSELDKKATRRDY